MPSLPIDLNKDINPITYNKFVDLISSFKNFNKDAFHVGQLPEQCYVPFEI
jgi:hypothetical protein